jgi:hypothetical protein
MLVICGPQAFTKLYTTELYFPVLKRFYFTLPIMAGQRHGQYHDSDRILHISHGLLDYGASHGNPYRLADAHVPDGIGRRKRRNVL